MKLDGVKYLKESILDIFYPRRCPICGEIVNTKGEYVCLACCGKPILIGEPRCKKCSKPIEDEEVELCHDCKKNHHNYSLGYALWLYDATMKKSIADFKYKGRREYGDFYVCEIIKHLGAKIKELNPDIIVPIPLHKLKERKRGFNQAEVIAGGISRELKIPMVENLIVRNKNTLPQKQLNDVQRLRNLEQAFSISEKEYKKYKGSILKVLLIDDIYTTGSTIEACTKILQKNGVQKVYFVCLCIGKGF